MPTRRTFLSGSLACGAALALPGCRVLPAKFNSNPFTLGVASGYPTPTSVVLWTRLAPSPLEPDGGMPPASVRVQWEVATDELMTKVVRRGTERAEADWGHSIHVEPRGLEPGREYWYRFTAGDARSVVGRTRTAPALGSPTARLKLAVASCQQYEHGYFGAYQHMVRDDLDLIVHTGDYIYEVSWGEARVRDHTLRETLTLGDYRLQYGLYKSDPDLAAAHAACPWIVTWDDHEVRNDYAGDLADASITREVFRARRLAAYRAYYENMPLPAAAKPTDRNMRIYTQRSYGDLASLYALDQRQYRSPQVCRKSGTQLQHCVDAEESDRTMLGDAQESWLFGALKKSRSRWNLLAQGTVMSYIDEDPGPGKRFWHDGWNGFPAARQRLMNHLAENQIANPVVLSGDVHAFLASGLRQEPANPDSPIVAAELVATSVSSQGTPKRLLDNWLAINPNLLIATGEYRGYVRVDLTRDRLTADFVALDTVKERNTGARTLRQFVIEAERPGPVAS